MTSLNLASPTRTAAPASVRSQISRLWAYAIRPHDSVQDVELQRQSRLLATMVIITFLVGAVLIAALIAASPVEMNATDVRAFLYGILILPVMYVLNRLGKVTLAARLYVLVMYAAPALSAYDISSGSSSLAFVGAAYLMAGIFFEVRGFLIFTSAGTVFIGIMLAIAYTVPGSSIAYNPVGYVSIYFIIIVMAFLVSAFITNLRTTEALRRRELEAANAGLRVSEAQLEQRVKDRTAELVRALSEAEQANLVKSAFLASMSHELRTPLNAIINFSKFVARGTVGPINDKQTIMLTNVVTSGEHLLNLINDVLDMSKIESGSLNLFVESNIDVGAICQSAVTTAHSLIGEKPIVVQTELAADLPLITGDRQRILQVLLNIVSNACKFTEEGQITISAKVQADVILIAVSDTGPGIPHSEWELVFEAFKQTETGLRKAGGTGLGMPISRSLVEAHGGSMWLDSTVGKGTTFSFTLPLQSALKVATR